MSKRKMFHDQNAPSRDGRRVHESEEKCREEGKKEEIEGRRKGDGKGMERGRTQKMRSDYFKKCIFHNLTSTSASSVCKRFNSPRAAKSSSISFSSVDSTIDAIPSENFHLARRWCTTRRCRIKSLCDFNFSCARSL